MSGAEAKHVPAFVNVSAGTGATAMTALQSVGRYDAVAVAAEGLVAAIREAVAGGARRVMVAGGDGTIACAASAVAGTPTELAIVAGGTLNHFARDHGIAEDQVAAARAGVSGTASMTDVAYVGDRLFLNTSSVGVYVEFVERRERWKPRLGYAVASVLAALLTIGRVRGFHAALEIDGKTQTFRTALLFIGVGERELKFPEQGSRVNGGRRQLHVMVVRGWTASALMSIGLGALVRGVDALRRTSRFDSALVDRVEVTLPNRHSRVAVDGEVVTLTGPLQYRIERDALWVVGSAAEAPTRG